MKHITLCAFTMLFIASAELSSQAFDKLPAYSRVRIHTVRTAVPTVGWWIASLHMDTVTVAMKGNTTIAIPLHSVTSLEVSHGRAFIRSAAINAGIGAAIGGTFGLLLKTILEETEGDPEFWKIPVYGALLVGTVGTLIGLIAGIHERWILIPLRLSGYDAPPATARFFRVAVSVHF